MYIKWDKRFVTGIKKIDDQHKKLIYIINKLYKNVVENKDGSLVNELLIDLKIYTIIHFSDEEKLLKKYHYPKEKEHIQIHQVFINKISEELYDIKSSTTEQGQRLIKFLKVWIVSHILEQDMEYVSFLRKHKDFSADLQKDIE